MLRILLNVLTALSLLLCAATIALWVRSYWRYDHVMWARFVRQSNPARGEEQGAFVHRSVEIRISRGRAMSEWGQFWIWDPFPHPTWTHVSDVSPPDFNVSGKSIRARLGFERYAIASGAVGFTFPMWPLVLLFAAPPLYKLVASIRQRRRSRRDHGTCPTCGYDLRATPSRCPECGREPARLSRTRST